MIISEVDRVSIPVSAVHKDFMVGQIVGIGCDQLCIAGEEDEEVLLIYLDKNERVEERALAWSTGPLRLISDSRYIAIGFW